MQYSALQYYGAHYSTVQFYVCLSPLVFPQDIFINVVGGLQMKEPAADLAIAMAIQSSYCNVKIPPDMAFIGEVGLHGELRPVSQLERRVNEAQKMGFTACVVPKLGMRRSKDSIALPCATLKDVWQLCTDLSGR